MQTNCTLMPAATIPEHGSIMVCSVFLDCDSDVLVRFETTLAPDERARAARFLFPRDRIRYTAARGILRNLLGACLKEAPSDLEFEYGPAGKPRLRLRHSARLSTRLEFNVSHSHGLAVFAIARDRNLGVDVEWIRARFDGEEIAQRYFSTREVEELHRLPPEERMEGFFNCWTRKEAYLKADGKGLQIPLDSFDVTLAPRETARFVKGVGDDWHLATFAPTREYVAALVYDGPPAVIRHRSWVYLSRCEGRSCFGDHVSPLHSRELEPDRR